jgi:3-deoxy-D-manno-octulosonic-acid transferase
METEIWPNLVAACRRRAIPLVLANARLSGKSMRRYAWLGRLARATLRELSAVMAQTESDAARLRALGAPHVVVVGNMKFDILPPPSQLDAGRALRASFGARQVLLAASTREGEEALILEALKGAPLGDALLVVVPRHPQRFDQVAALFAEGGYRLLRRSARTPVTSDTQVLLGDSMGEMFMYYASSDIAFVGGSLLPLGGQNLIEACASGVPVLVGPHTFNFAEATEQALAAGAALRISDAGELLRTALALLADDGRRRAMAAAGIAFARQHRGATEKTMELLARLMEKAG